MYTIIILNKILNIISVNLSKEINKVSKLISPIIEDKIILNNEIFRFNNVEVAEIIRKS